MAQRIEGVNKETLIERDVPIENKYTADCYNEQKTVINANADELDETVNKVSSLSSGLVGTLTIAQALTISEDGIYRPTESGTYTFPDSSTLDIDLTLGFVEIFVSGDQTVFEKQVTTVNTIPTGSIEDGNIYAVSGDTVNNVTSKKADLIVGKNKFDIDAITDNYYITATGSIVSSTSYVVSDYIEVTYGIDYISNVSSRFHCFYDINKDVVSGGSNSIATQYTVPLNAVYVRLSITNANYMNSFQFEEGTVATDYEEYKVYVDPNQILVEEDTDIPILAEYNNNAFDYSNVQEGYRYDLYSSSLIEDLTYVASLFYFPVEEGDILRSVLNYGEANFTGQYYDENKDYLSGALFNSTLELTVPTNAKYVRFSCKTENRLVKLITKNSTELKYEKAGLFLPSEYDVLNKSMFNGMIYNSVGDSITAQQKWQGYLITKYGLEWRNKGLGGQKMSGAGGMWFTSFDSGNDLEIDSDIDLVTLNFGANDWAQNRVIGSQDSTNTDEILGAFNSYVNSFYTTFPTKILIVIGTTLCAVSGSFTNTLGYTTRDISEAIKERCLYFGIPFADVISNYGINEYNYTNFSNDEIHPNDLGAERMAGVIIGTMESIDNYKN